jgi:hypothetical protein
MSPEETFRCPHCGQQHPAGTTYCPINGLPIESTDTQPMLLGLPLKRGINRWWVIGGAAVVGVILCLAAFVTLSILSERNRAGAGLTPTILVIQPSQVGTTPAPGVILITATPGTQATAVSEPWQACPEASYLSRLRIGDTTEVSSDPPLANRVRSEPLMDAEVLGFIQPGEDALVVDGPGCSNGWVWWKVESKETDAAGWTAEGDSSTYWLVPVIP